MLKVLVIGKSGQLGSSFLQLSQTMDGDSLTEHPSDGFKIEVIGRPETELTCHKSIHQLISEKHPDIVINASAFTAVDDAETQESEAFQLNALAPAHMATACKHLNIPFIHISTDYVFNGSSSEPYQPDAAVSPINAYGRSKLAGEWACQSAHPQGAYIIRTSWVFSEWGNNFVKTMLKLAESKPKLDIVSDQHGAPTYAKDLAVASLEMAQCIIKGNESKPGIYHITNNGYCSWYEFAKEILRTQDTEINETSSENFPRPAKRPKYSKLCTKSTQNIFQLTLRPWQEALTECLNALKA